MSLLSNRMLKEKAPWQTHRARNRSRLREYTSIPSIAEFGGSTTTWKVEDTAKKLVAAPMRSRRAVLFEEIADDALVYSKEHKASYPGDRSTIGKLLTVFGKTPVTEITPQSIKAYLDTRDDLTKTTINRYRGTLSMIFQEAIRNGKVEQNPARLVRLHREDNGRVRFVTYEEEALIRRVVRERCPIHESELTLALETGMRRGRAVFFGMGPRGLGAPSVAPTEDEERNSSGCNPDGLCD